MDYSQYPQYVPLEKMTVIENHPQYLVVHCSDSDVDDFKSIQRYHIIDRGWENIGYNYLIERDGTLKNGRPETYHGAHVAEDNMNYKSLGICLCGKFENKMPSQAQINTLKTLLNTLKVKYSIPLANILPHRHWNKGKTCPGSMIPDTFGQSLIEVAPVLDYKDKIRQVINILQGIL